MKIKKINLKPIDADIHLKYRCPNPECYIDHWLSILETQTKDFKIVCDCGTICRPKRIARCKILYKKSKKIQKPATHTEDAPIEKIELSHSIPKELLDSAVNVLSAYGFTKKESIDLISQAYSDEQNNDIGTLVKIALRIFGENNGK